MTADDERDLARRQLARRAEDTDEEWDLLTMLGLET